MDGHSQSSDELRREIADRNEQLRVLTEKFLEQRMENIDMVAKEARVKELEKENEELAKMFETTSNNLIASNAKQQSLSAETQELKKKLEKALTDKNAAGEKMAGMRKEIRRLQELVRLKTSDAIRADAQSSANLQYQLDKVQRDVVRVIMVLDEKVAELNGLREELATLRDARREEELGSEEDIVEDIVADIVEEEAEVEN